MRISLLNLPFAALNAPSLALTQLRAVVTTQLPEATVNVHYLNHDFGQWVGVALYTDIATRSDHLYSGLGDWFFRSVAFPDIPNNDAAYFQRFYPRPDQATKEFRASLERIRSRLNIFLDRLIDAHRLLDSDLVGMTSMFAQTVACLALAKKLKAARPNIITVLGGANCEAEMGQALASSAADIDFVCSGPGLRSFPELVRRLIAGGDWHLPIPGIVPGARSAVASRVAPGGAPLLGEELSIDEPVDLDYHEFLDTIERNFPDGIVKPTLFFETSRGCWWGAKAHCTFCGLNGSTMQYRIMSSAKALDQFQALFRYVPRCTHFSCVDNILPKSYLRDVFPKLRPPEGVTVFYEVKADLTADEVRVLAVAGVRAVQPGIESLATSTLKLMRKGTSAFTNLRMLTHCRLLGVMPIWNLLLGFPGEESTVFTKYLHDIPLVHHLPPPTGAYPVRFDRFSPYFEQAAAYGLELQPLDMYAYVYPFSAEIVADLAYYFADARYEAEYQSAMLAAIQPVRTAVARWQERYNGTDGGRRAELFRADRAAGGEVWDSRSGVMKVYELLPEERDLLAALARPRTRQELVAVCTLRHDVDEHLSNLRDRGLIFEEGEHMASLVLPEGTGGYGLSLPIPAIKAVSAI